MNLLDIGVAPILLFGLVGLLFGSFATAAAYRLPRNKDIVFAHSRCTSCDHILSVLDLVPLLSWLFNRGKCRHCNAKIGIRYLMTELATAALFVVTYLRHGASVQSLLIMLLVVDLVILSVIDFEHYIIPDGVNLTVGILGVAFQWFSGTPWHVMLLGACVGGAIGLALRWGMYAWKKQEGLGMGDVKFLAAAGIWMTLWAWPALFFIAGVLGIAIALIWRYAERGERFPFGPALAAALYICVLFPQLGEIIEQGRIFYG